MEYDDSETAVELAERTREFMEAEVRPAEREALEKGRIEEGVRHDLQAKARDYGIYAPQIGEEYGGMGLDFHDVLPTFEVAGRYLMGASAIRIDAPDEGNMHTLELLGTEEQKEEYLKPLVADELRSGFSMTEPPPGAGSDPKMIQTTAELDGDEWVIDGHKWWTSNGGVADFLIVMARTDEDAHPYEGCSLILVPVDTDGVEIVRDIPHMGGGLGGDGHAEIRYDDVRVPEENLLGELNMGFTHAQQRLGPARLTHCMRFSGMAQRSLDIAKAYMSEREAFGSPLADKQELRYKVADAEIRLHAARSMVRHAARQIAAGNEARIEVAMSKVFTANVVNDIIDETVQMCGANGIGKDLPIAYFYEGCRSFRIVDGADEVHKRVIARDAFDDVDPTEVEHVLRFEEKGAPAQ